MNRDMTLGGQVFSVPPLPIAHNIEAYPRLQKLNNNGFAERWKTAGPTEEDLSDLSTVLFLCAKAADPELTIEAFRAMPITPLEMLLGFMVAKFQSGGWSEIPAGTDAGEDQGEPKPPTSTSAESSEG